MIGSIQIPAAANIWINFVAAKRHCISFAAFFSGKRFGYLSRRSAIVIFTPFLCHRYAMKNRVFRLFAVLAFTASSAFAQAINVTPTGVDIGATTTAGALLQQSGQTTTFWSKDGVNTPSLLVKIQGDGNVGIGTSSPGEKLAVAGNATVSGSATVGSLVVGASTILTVGSFESTPQAFPGTNTTLTLAHGLGGVPKFSTVSLRCITSEFGWVAGDEILLSSIHMRSDNAGFTTGVNSTQFKLRQLANIYVHRLDAGGIAYITPANWRLVFRAWR